MRQTRNGIGSTETIGFICAHLANDMIMYQRALIFNSAGKVVGEKVKLQTNGLQCHSYLFQ